MDINRKTAYDTLLEIERTEAYSNIELNRQISQSKPDSPGFVRELVYGVLENKILMDFYLDRLIPSGIAKVKKQDLVLLRMGIYQIGYMDSVPEYAAVNETVNMAKKLCRGRDKFINGVLRGYIANKDSIRLPNPAKNPIDYLRLKYSFETWIAKLWYERFGLEEAERLMQACNETPGLTVRVNTLKTDAASLRQKLLEEEILCEETHCCGSSISLGTPGDEVARALARTLEVKGSRVLETREYAQGLFAVQDEGSVIIVETLEPQPGETIIDMCAAPGGKTLAMAEMMENRGRIYAFDVYEHKLEIVRKEAARLGISIVETDNKDGEVLQEDILELADRVLCDVPCTGLGVIRRKPEIKYKEVLGNGAELAEKQLRILSNGAKYVKFGGFLLYSTCTINIIENEEVIKDFINENRDFEIIEQRQLLPHIDGTDGFFLCKMKRVKG